MSIIYLYLIVSILSYGLGPYYSSSQEIPSEVNLPLPESPHIPLSLASDVGTSSGSSGIPIKHKNARKVFHRQSLPNLIHEGMLEVFHLRSFPQLLIESESGRFLIQTSALALRGVETQRVLVFEYTPYNYSACYLPIIETNEDVTRLVWDKRAVITYREELDISFWQQSTYLATINAVVYENYINWLGKYIQRQNIFIPQAVCSTSDITTCFTKSQTWDSFLQHRFVSIVYDCMNMDNIDWYSCSFDVLSQLAVQMRAILPPR